MAGLNAWGNEARDRLILEKMGDEVELLVEKAETIKHQGFDRMAGGHNPHFGVLLRRLINNLRDTEFFKHARDQTQVTKTCVRYGCGFGGMAGRYECRTVPPLQRDRIGTQKLLNDT